MDLILEIASKYYLVFTVISVILVLALIGYLVTYNSKKDLKVSKKGHVEQMTGMDTLESGNDNDNQVNMSTEIL